MKKIYRFFHVFCLLHLIIGICWPKEASGNSTWGITVYKSSGVKDNTNLTIASVNLAEYGYTMIYQYVLVDAKTLFVLGIEQSETITVSAISLDEGKLTSIKQYPEHLVWSLSQAKFTVFFMQHEKTSPPFVIVRYATGNLAKRLDETETYLDILGKDENKGYILLNHEKIEETNLVLDQSSEARFKYRYLEVDTSPDGSVLPGPARKDIAKVLFDDANGDGFPDILIWKRRYISRAIDDDGPGDFLLDHETIDVMFFQTERMAFSPAVPLDSKRWKSVEELHFYGYWK